MGMCFLENFRITVHKETSRDSYGNLTYSFNQEMSFTDPSTRLCSKLYLFCSETNLRLEISIGFSLEQTHLSHACCPRAPGNGQSPQSLLTHLLEATEEVEYLRHENTQLRRANRELNKHLSILMHDKVQPQFVSAHYSIPHDIVVEVERFSLPKSSSVRSNGYLNTKMTRNNSGNGGRIRPSTMPSTTKSPIKVAYTTGIVENRTQQQVAGNWRLPIQRSAQFAHGINQLRPVIRHPRYKVYGDVIS